MYTNKNDTMGINENNTMGIIPNDVMKRNRIECIHVEMVQCMKQLTKL